MEIKKTRHGGDQYSESEGWQAVNEDGVSMSHASFGTCDSRYKGNYLKTLLICGIGTSPEYRRGGYVRKMIEGVFETAPERDWTVAMLHPFSFSYYRKFGFEKISDHRILEFPMSALDFIPRYPNLVKLDGESRLSDIISVYEKFGERKNIMFRRYNAGRFPLKPSNDRTAYIYYNESGSPEGYVITGIENYYYVNRMVSVNLHVHELVFNSPAALYAILGFLRMYEGELDTIKLHDCAMSPEIDMVLRHYTHTKYTIIPDIMGRVLNVPRMLEANRYPVEGGRFSFRLEDSLPYTRGCWSVEYADKKCEIKKLDDGASVDFELPMPAFTAMVYGYEAYTPENCVYLPGMKLHNPDSDFFRVYGKQENGLFEHF